ncbi:putative hemolysin [Clostridiales Family XIII bacterium PM5-7]
MLSGPSTMPLAVLIALIVMSVFCNGLVVLSNTAMNSISRSKLKQMITDDDNHDAAILAALLEKPSKYRFTNRFLNYLFLIAGLYFTIALPYQDWICIVVFVVIAVPLGEIFPRKIGQQHSERLALSLYRPQRITVILFTPIIVILTFISDLFLKLFRQETIIEDGGYSEDQVMSILEVGQQSGEIKEEGKKMINSIFQFDDELAYEIMTPRTDVFVIDINDSTDEYLDQLMELRYSRIPVCEGERDNIIGILHIKDYLIKARESGFDKVDIKSILRKPYFVPETKNIDALYFELQKEKQHIAILIDEYGGFGGIVTLEDIIEEVMGDIDDEYDEAEHIIEKIDDNNYYVDGNVSLSDLNEEININLESDNSETIGGFIIDILGEIPEDGDENREVTFEHYVLTILSVKERRIEKVKLHINPIEDEQDEEE